MHCQLYQAPVSNANREEWIMGLKHKKIIDDCWCKHNLKRLSRPKLLVLANLIYHFGPTSQSPTGFYNFISHHVLVKCNYLHLRVQYMTKKRLHTMFKAQKIYYLIGWFFIFISIYLYYIYIYIYIEGITHFAIINFILVININTSRGHHTDRICTSKQPHQIKKVEAFLYQSSSRVTIEPIPIVHLYLTCRSQ